MWRSISALRKRSTRASSTTRDASFIRKRPQSTFAIARDLVQKGVQPNAVYAHVYESNSISALLLQSRVLSTLELAEGNHVAILTDEQGNAQRFRSNYEEADGLVNIPLKSEDVRVSVFFRENMEGLFRCSLRSKGGIDVGGDRPDVRRRRP